MIITEITKDIKGIDHLKNELKNHDPISKTYLIPRQHRSQLIRSRKESYELKILSRERDIVFLLK